MTLKVSGSKGISWTIYLLLMVISSYFISGCSPKFYLPLKTTEARLGAETQTYENLTSLPAPKEKIVAAVYKFRDQTGQYKPSEFFQNFSTAITQGATSILLRSLEESKWFVPIERENLNNLLNERKIIRSSRTQYSMENGNNKEDLLPPLLFAGIILEGGIISYDANVITGGAGLRYFGTGASGQYREDKITVYLRAISTGNGRILKTVYTSKTILSQMVDVGLFRFVKFKRLLEVETGYTHNEPTQMAVTEAIEKAVESLIIEGVLENLWVLADSSDMSSPVIENYKEEKKENKKVDSFDRYLTEKRKKFAIGLHAGLQLYDGDYVNTVPRELATLSFNYSLNPTVSLSLEAGKGALATEEVYRSTFFHHDFMSTFRFMPKYRFTPSVRLGFGLLVEEKNGLPDYSGYNHSKLIIGLGFEFLPGKNLGLHLNVDYNQMLDDKIDDAELGMYNDSYWRSTLGISYYFGRKLQ